MSDRIPSVPEVALLPEGSTQAFLPVQPSNKERTPGASEEIFANLSAEKGSYGFLSSGTLEQPLSGKKPVPKSPLDIPNSSPTTAESGLVSEQREQFVPAEAFRPDTIAQGVIILLVLAGLQRLIGFGRAVWFCRHLPPEELGKWEIVFSFLNLAAPMVILSLPGAFGRYAERYRQQGQLRSFLRQTAWVCTGLTAAAGLAMFAAQNWLDLLLFGGAGAENLLAVLPWTLASIITLNYLTELFTALRNARITALFFFLNSILFALLGVGLLAEWRNDALAVTAAYGLANLLTAALALEKLRRNYHLLPPEPVPLQRGELWRQLLPFALSVWSINLATNLFSIVDRYLIVHFAPGGPEAALALVGQYHSSRLLPLLLLSVLQMLGAMILPYMSTDWERGEVQRAGCRLRLALKLLSVGMTALAAAALAGAPLLFQTALADKFQTGQQVLPGTLCYCIWFGLTLVAQNYLWCTEKAYLATLALLFGLATNICLNIWLLPRWALAGVVVGTSLAHLAALAVMLLLAYGRGFQPDKALLALLVLPASLLLGPVGAFGILAFMLLVGLRTGKLFSAEEKALLQEGLLGKWSRWSWLAVADRRPPTPEPLP